LGQSPNHTKYGSPFRAKGNSITLLDVEQAWVRLRPC